MSTIPDYLNGEPEPIHNEHPSIHDLVIADMEKRKQMGYDKYKTYLQKWNGRKALQDLYEELLDACCYLRQQLEEDKDTLQWLNDKA